MNVCALEVFDKFQSSSKRFYINLFLLLFKQMVYILASNGANNIWEHTMLDPAQNKHGRRKPGPRDPLQ